MKIRTTDVLIVLFTTLPYLSGFTQNQVTGKVVDVNDQAIPAASVLELPTGRETLTDINGEFRIAVTDSSLLKISFLGYQDTVVRTGKAYYFIELKELPELTEHWVYSKSFSIGYFGDFRYLPWGFSIAHLRPYTKLPFLDRSKFLSGEINFKTNSDFNYDLNLSFTWHHVYHSNHFSLDIRSLFHERKLGVNEFDLENKDFQLIFVNTINQSFSISAGLIKRKDTYVDSLELIGYHFSANKYILKLKQTVSGYFSYFGDYSEFGFSFNQDLSKLINRLDRFHFGLVYNNYHRYNEINLLLKYNVYY